MPSDQGPTDPRRDPPDSSGRADTRRDASDREPVDPDDDLGQVHEQRPASDYYDDDPYDDYDDGPRLLARRLVQGGVALLAVVLFLGVVWYAYTWGSRTATTGDVPVVAAPQGEEKVKPEDPGGMDVPHQDKLVMNPDADGESGQVERLLPPPEEPRPPEQSQPAQSEAARQDQATAPAGDGEQVADLPETTVPDQDMPESEAGASTPDDPVTDPATDETTADTATSQSAEVPTRTPGRKPGGVQTDADGTQADGTGETQTAAADPAQRASDAGDQAADGEPAGTTADGRYAVQLAAFQSEQAARNAWSSYRERFPQLLSGQRLLLQNAQVNGQTYWRVRTGPFADRSTAQSLCDRLKAQDQSCLPVTR